MSILFFAVSLFSSIVGSICGIGGGVIIKPVLDAVGVMSVSSISFLSGCTVLSMSLISVSKQLHNKEKSIDLKLGTSLAIGSALGGMIGKELFQYAYVIFSNEGSVGLVQSALLAVITVGTLIYTLVQTKIKTKHISNGILCGLIGLLLGVMSSFLGIGGGPINLIVLAYFFSMDTKKAAANSLYIIMFSQLTSLISTLIKGTVPEFSLLILLLMVAGGFLGGMFGSKINKKISSQHVNYLFCILMLVIIGINVYNIYKFSMLV